MSFRRLICFLPLLAYPGVVWATEEVPGPTREAILAALPEECGFDGGYRGEFSIEDFRDFTPNRAKEKCLLAFVSKTRTEEAVQAWLEKNNFEIEIHREDAPRLMPSGESERGVIMVAGYDIEKNGIFYGSKFINSISPIPIHNQSIRIHWRPNGDVRKLKIQSSTK